MPGFFVSYRMTSSGKPLSAVLTLWAAVSMLLPNVAWGQHTRLFPDTPTFRYPLASPQVEGFVARLVRTTVADNPLGTGAEGDVRIGKIFPFLALEGGERPLHLGVGVVVSGRFSLQTSGHPSSATTGGSAST